MGTIASYTPRNVRVLHTLPPSMHYIAVRALADTRGEVRVPDLTLDELFRDDYGPLVAFLRKSGFGRDQAEDAASEAMTCAYESWSQIESPRAWVRTVAYRIACSQAKRAHEEAPRALAGGWVTSIQDDIDDIDVVEAAEERDELLGLLQQLPGQQRLVMAWHLDGFRTKEISEGLGMPPATVRSTLRHARNRLKAAYWTRFADSEGRE